MKVRPYFEKLEASEQYKDFVVKYPDSFMIAGFFIIDLEGGNNVHQIDFYVPSEKKVAAFSLDGAVDLKMLETVGMKGKMPERLNYETNMDLDELQGVLLDEMHNRGMSENIKKIIAVLQNIDGKKIWNLNCILTGMEILKSHVEDSSKTILKIEKTSLMDIMKRIPVEQMQKAPKSEKKDLKGELAKLDKVRDALAKEKQRLEKELKGKDGRLDGDNSEGKED